MPKQTKEQQDMEKAMENLRLQVVGEELLARLNKASYDKMFYYLQGVDIFPKYNDTVQESERRRVEQEANRRAQGEQTINSVLATPDPITYPEFTPEAPSGSVEIGPVAQAEE